MHLDFDHLHPWFVSGLGWPQDLDAISSILSEDAAGLVF